MARATPLTEETQMLTKKLFALALASALGLSMTAANARTFDHRDSGYHQSRHGEFRHGKNFRHHDRHHHFHRFNHFNRGYR
jgi:hypothetical protein